VNDRQVLQRFVDAGALLDGHFVLSSGLHSARYLQCALVLQDPTLAGRLCRVLADKLGALKVDVVIGPALGGVVVAYELARALGAAGIFAERADGRMQLRRGFRIAEGQRVLLAEDVVTTGGSLEEVMAVVRASGGNVVGVASLVDRSGDRDPAFGVPFVSLMRIDVPTWPAEDCPLCRDGVPVMKPGSRPRA